MPFKDLTVSFFDVDNKQIFYGQLVSFSFKTGYGFSFDVKDLELVETLYPDDPDFDNKISF